MKLYYSPGACSLAPIIIAEWLGLKLDLVKTDIRQVDDAYKRKNPLGAVPALELDDGRVFTQADAILRYLCRQVSDADLLGRDIDEEFVLDQWSAFLTGDFHPAFGGFFRPKRFTTQRDDDAVAAVKEGFVKRIHTVTEVLDDHIGDSEHIALDRRTFLDAYAYAMVRWLRNFDGGLERYPNLQRVMDRLDDDPGVQAALKREQGAG